MTTVDTFPPYNSISALQKWEECPKAYRFRYLDKPDIEEVEEDAEHLRRGRAVHECFETAYKAMRDRKLNGSLAQVLDEALAQLDISWTEANLDGDQESKKAAAEAIEKTLVQRTTGHAMILGIEHEFRMPLPSGVGFLGYADLIEQCGPEAIEILDWKITYKPKSADTVFTSFQLNCYGWAVKQTWPWVKEIWVGENYPMVGEAVRVKLSDEHMDFAIARFEADVEAMHSETEWDAVVGRHCEWCPFRSVCPALAGIPADQLDF